MSTVTESRPAVKQRKPRAKPQRFARLDDRPSVDEPALLTLHVGGKEFDYWLRLVPSDFGEAFQLTKIVPTGDGPAELGEVYHVLCEDAWPEAPRCDCMGALRWGHCKHADAIKTLREKGKL
jgi:hypothetical protein